MCISALRHLLGHTNYGNVSGTYIDFKTTKTPVDKKANSVLNDDTTNLV